MTPFARQLVQREPWTGLAMGNHALARAMIEAGVQVATTYPGSPTPEIAAALTSVPEAERPYYFEYSTNEKVALEVAAGASANGRLSAVFFKSVGLNVASDSLVQLPLMELIGGMVVVLGDDPGANSSQNEQDNRHFARMAYMPMLEPATPAEAHRMFLTAADLSRRHRFPVLVRMTTHVCHAKEVVSFGPAPAGEGDWTPRFSAANGPYIPIAATVFPLKRKALAKLALVADESDASPWNAVSSPNGEPSPDARRRGVISASLPALGVLEALHATGAAVDLLKLGLSFPLPRGRILDFLRGHDEVLVIEELDRVMETEIKAMAFDEGLHCRILARVDAEDLMGEIGPKRALSLMARAWPDAFTAPSSPAAASLPPRIPQMCPGCGHRSAFHAIKNALPEGAITVGDIGCHSLGFYPPYEVGEFLLCMGHSNGSAAGMAIRNTTRKVISFIGDSTLFHAGLPGIVNAIVQNHDITLVVMDNGTTAMTGHQPRAGSGEVGEKISIKALLELLGAKKVLEVDTYRQDGLGQALEEAMAHRGFSVVIARHPCMLKLTRERRGKDEQRPVRVRVDEAVCNRSHVCVERFGCPSFVRREDGSVTVHEDLCIGDGSCVQICPVKAIGRPKTGGAS